jgi:hypothetical protein
MFRLVLHGYVAPTIRDEIDAAGAAVETIPASGWDDAVARIAAADVTLVTQAHGAGDATAVASKVYEYLALGRPVLCLTDGGATEALLHRLGVAGLCGRLGDEQSIGAALDRLADGGVPAAVPPDRLEPYDRARTARRLAEILDAIAG